MAIAHETATESASSASQASFDISVPFTASSDGLLVFTHVNANADDALSVKIDPDGANTDVPAVTGGRALNTGTEPGDTKAWFLAGGLPTTTTTVRINRNNNANTMYAVAITVTADTGMNPAVHEAGIVLVTTIGTLAEENVDDGSPGTNSVRYAAINSGLGTPPAAGASSTILHTLDGSARGFASARENTAGQGSRPVGFSSGTSDDRAAVYLAIKEVTAPTVSDDDPGETGLISGVVRRLATVALAATLLAGQFQVGLGREDEIGTPAPTPTISEDYFVVLPIVEPIRRQAYTDDDVIVQVEAVQPIDEEYILPTKPSLQRFMVTAFSADDEIATEPLPRGVDEDFRLVVPPKAQIPPLAITADDEIVTAPQPAISEDYLVVWPFVVVSVPRTVSDDDVIAISQPDESYLVILFDLVAQLPPIVAMVADDEITTPPPPLEVEDEPYFPRAIPPTQFAQPTTADDEITTPAAPLSPDEDFWIPAPFKTLPAVVAVSDDEVWVSTPLQVEEDFWIAQPPPVKAPPRAFFADDEITTPPVPLNVEEDVWIPKPMRPITYAAIPIHLIERDDIPELPQPPAPLTGGIYIPIPRRRRR